MALIEIEVKMEGKSSAEILPVRIVYLTAKMSGKSSSMGPRPIPEKRD